MQGLDATGCVVTPKVLEALLGTRLRGRGFARTPLIAGSRNSVAISADGDVFSWGWNSRGTLGHGHRNPVPKPRRIAGLRGCPIVQVALGGWHTLYLDAQGQIWASGGDEYNQCGQGAVERDVLVPTMCLHSLRVCQVSAGGMHSLALTEDGQLWTFGEPWGSFSMVIDRSARRVVPEDPEEVAERGGFVAISCGAFHNLALTASGDVYSWGLNDYGQLGLGHTSSVVAPRRIVEGLEGVQIADFSCGGWHSGLLSTAGEVYVFGRGEYGRLGLSDKSGSSKLRPTKIWIPLDGIKIVQVSCGGSHTMAVASNGTAWAWGRGSFGRLGTGEERVANAPIEIPLPGGPERGHVGAVAAGGRHSLVYAVPETQAGDLDERHSEGWEEQQRRRRSPMGLSPQASGAGLFTAFTNVGGGAGAGRRSGDGGSTGAETGVGGTPPTLINNNGISSSHTTTIVATTTIATGGMHATGRHGRQGGDAQQTAILTAPTTQQEQEYQQQQQEEDETGADDELGDSSDTMDESSSSPGGANTAMYHDPFTTTTAAAAISQSPGQHRALAPSGRGHSLVGATEGMATLDVGEGEGGQQDNATTAAVAEAITTNTTGNEEDEDGELPEEGPSDIEKKEEDGDVDGDSDDSMIGGERVRDLRRAASRAAATVQGLRDDLTQDRP